MHTPVPRDDRPIECANGPVILYKMTQEQIEAAVGPRKIREDIKRTIAPRKLNKSETDAKKEEVKFITLTIPIVDRKMSYGMELLGKYEQFGDQIEFAQLDRNKLISETFGLVQTVINLLVSESKAALPDKSYEFHFEETSQLIVWHNQQHIEGVEA